MSTIATPGGDYIHVAAQYRLETEDSEHTHSTTVLHSHGNADIPENLFAKNLQVSVENSSFDSSLPAGLVVESATVTENLDLIDDAFLRVQPDEEEKTSILIGFDPENMSEEQAGVFVYKGGGGTGANDVIVINNKAGIRAPEHTIEGANFVSEWDVSTNHDVDVGSITKTPQLRTTHIKLYADGHTKLKIDAPILIRGGGINVSNMSTDIYKAKGIDLNKGDIVCRKLFAAGTVEGLRLFESDTSRTHEGKDAHFKTLTADDGSIYIGLMRRSYDRATHKPVTHIFKRQIPTYLAAEGFVLGDIPAPYTVENMTINNWVTLAQVFKNDTSIEIDTVFPAATTGDWESYIDPISIDLDAAEAEIDDHESRITVLEGASSGGGELSNLTLLTASSNNDTINISPDTVGLVLIAHDNLSGINVYLPALNDRDIILVKNLNLADGGDESILLHAHEAGTPATAVAKFDGRWTTIELRSSSNASNTVDSYTNQCARLQYITLYPGYAIEQDIYCRLNDSY